MPNHCAHVATYYFAEWHWAKGMAAFNWWKEGEKGFLKYWRMSL